MAGIVIDNSGDCVHIVAPFSLKKHQQVLMIVVLVFFVSVPVLGGSGIERFFGALFFLLSIGFPTLYFFFARIHIDIDNDRVVISHRFWILNNKTYDIHRKSILGVSLAVRTSSRGGSGTYIVMGTKEGKNIWLGSLLSETDRQALFEYLTNAFRSTFLVVEGNAKHCQRCSTAMPQAAQNCHVCGDHN